MDEVKADRPLHVELGNEAAVVAHVELLVANGGGHLLDGELGHLQVLGDAHRLMRGAPKQLQLSSRFRNCNGTRRLIHTL